MFIHKTTKKNAAGVLVVIGVIIGSLMWSGLAGAKDLPKVPPEYAEKKMPAGWWTNPKMIKAGQKVYEGRITYLKPLPKEQKKCFKCHGVNGKPKMRKARDFRAQAKIATFTDSYWFWRVSEGVPKTKMESWKDFLTEEQIWQVMAYEHTFSHGGKPAEHLH